MKTYPGYFRPALHAVMWNVLLSGLALLPGAIHMRWEWSVPWHLSSGTRVWVAAWHAASFMAMLMLTGAVWTVHVRAGWVRRENIVSGVGLLAAFGLLALSGLGLYYAGGETLPVWSLAAHLGAGGLAVLFYVWHRHGARKAEQRSWPNWVTPRV